MIARLLLLLGGSWVRIAIYGAALAALLAFYAQRVHVERDYGRNEVQAKWDKDIAARKSQALKTEQEFRARETSLQVAIDQTEKDKADAIQDLNRRHAAALASVRNRPDRPKPTTTPNVPKDAEPQPPAIGCTGYELYRPDGEFLIGEAARGDQLRIALKACYRAWDEAEKVINRPLSP